MSLIRPWKNKNPRLSPRPGAADDDLARLAVASVLALRVDNAHVGARAGQADGAGSGHLVGMSERHGDDHAGLGEPVGLDPRNAPPLYQLGVDLRRDPDMDGQADAVVPVAFTWRRLEEQAGRRGDAEQDSDLVVAYHVPVARDAEPAHRDKRSAGDQGQQQLPGRVVVEELQAAEHPVRAGELIQIGDERGEPQPVLVIDHAALGRPCRARGVVHVGDVASRLRRAPGGPLAAKRGEPARLAVTGYDEMFQIRATCMQVSEERLVFRVRDGDAGGRVAEDVPGVVAAQGRVERDEHAAGGDHRQPGDHELGPVGHHDRHLLARLDALLQVAGERLGLRPELRPGNGDAVVEYQRRLAWFGAAGGPDGVEQVPVAGAGGGHSYQSWGASLIASCQCRSCVTMSLALCRR